MSSTEKQGYSEKHGVDPQVVLNYLKGRGTDEEFVKIKHWFLNLETENDFRKISFDFWNELNKDSDTLEFDESKILGLIHHKLRIKEVELNKKKRVLSPFFRVISRIAAILFIPLLLNVFFNWVDLSSILDPQKNATAELFSPLGARTKFILPDGSTGWLNGGSKLVFPVKFNKNERVVELVGEAYFDVSKDPKRKFKVEVDKIEVVAHGTSFNVMAYTNEKNIEVTLNSGNVEILQKINEKESKSLGKLNPGDQGIFYKDYELYGQEKVDVSSYISWKEGNLIFRNDPLDEVIRRINRWYNIELYCSDKTLEKYYFRATFKDETIEEVLKLLKMSSPIGFQEIARETMPDGTFGKRKIKIYYKTKK